MSIAGTPESLRQLPSVDRLAVAVARAVLEERRAELLRGEQGEVDLVARAVDQLAPSLRKVINATGVIVHTNLGRAPLAEAAIAAVARAGRGYTNLEFDLDSGKRGSRHAHVEALLCELTGAEAALAVNNGAAAALLATAALADGGREVIVSRGQAIEIGGGFRIPEIVAQAGAALVEVGTTNRTRVSDYRSAVSSATAAILRVHASNFRTVGFVEQVEIESLCDLGIAVIDDLGSGLLADDLAQFIDEPSVRRSVRAGCALVCFSGDKLLGGPQAGILIGQREAIDRARAHPLARAVRIDKLSLAALAATLALYRDPDLARREVPVLAMLTTPRQQLELRASSLARATGGEVVEAASRVGGGALPLLELPGPVVSLTGDAGGVEQLARRLRRGDPAVLGRIHHDRLLLDPRTMSDSEIDAAGQAVRSARG